MFLKMAGGSLHIPHPTPLDPPLAIKLQRPSKESGINFSHLAPLVLFLITKSQSQKGMAQ